MVEQNHDGPNNDLVIDSLKSSPQRDTAFWFSPLIFVVYLLALIVAELLTNFFNPIIGLGFHTALLITLIFHATVARDKAIYRILLALVPCPLIRIVSITMPVSSFPYITWFMIFSIPIFISTIFVARLAGYTPRQLGLSLRSWRIQILVSLSGIILGLIEYSILQPTSAMNSSSWKEFAVSSLIILICTGLMEELVFRGILQHSAEQNLGKVRGLLFSAAVFTTLHLGWQSVADLVFVFCVALYWGWIVLKTRSIVGTTIAHGITNILLFLIIPTLIHPILASNLPQTAVSTPQPTIAENTQHTTNDLLRLDNSASVSLVTEPTKVSLTGTFLADIGICFLWITIATASFIGKVPGVPHTKNRRITKG